uniref:ABC transporter domain-containing protein n=1 Tax=Panagrolaimus superbus TaxID=310955 RepID=A0A914Z849_9BILA
MAFRYGLNHLTKVVIYHQEINFFAAPIYMPLWIPIFSLLFQSIFILILAFYFDAVIPIDDSPKKHPLFMFGMKYDDISESVKESELESLILEDSQKSSSAFSEFYFENDKNQMVAEIDVFHLSKKWSNNRFGVQDITFKAYQNQVTSILGHNGAGKSTTFSILAGFTKSSSGKVFVCGKEPRNLCQTSAVGYCPQWDPLFPHLDVREHLKFYQSLKGENNPEEIEEMIEKLGLCDFLEWQ